MSEPFQVENQPPSEGTAAQHFRFHFIKSNQFRVIHSDGVFGGPSPNGAGIHMSFFSERSPIPLVTEYEVAENGRIGKEVNRISRDGLVREIDVDVVVNIEVARSIFEWLRSTIEAYDKVKGGLKEGDK